MIIRNNYILYVVKSVVGKPLRLTRLTEQCRGQWLNSELNFLCMIIVSMLVWKSSFNAIYTMY